MDNENIQIEEEVSVTSQEKKKSHSFLIGVVVGALAAIFVAAILLLMQNILLTRKYTGATLSSVKEGEMSSVVSRATNTKMAYIQKLIQDYYYDEVEIEDLEQGVYTGMVAAIGDIYSEYYSPEALKDILEDTEGIYYGIGAYIGNDSVTGYPYISSVMPSTPAEEAGLRDGDIIVKVDDVDTEGMSTSEAVKYIKGPEYTKVLLTVARDGEDDYLEIEVERRQIETPTVKYEMLEDNIGFIQISEFDDVTLDQFVDAKATLTGQGMEGLIIDLRSNPGGNLVTACDIARQLLPKGLIVYTEDKNGKQDKYECDGKREFDKPLVVLVNGYSASASEILTGAIKDYGIGTIMGTKTFGKGIVQRIIPMSDGSAVKLTISKYYTPNGQNIHGIGIEPDVEVKFDADPYYENGIDNQKDAALDYIKKQIK